MDIEKAKDLVECMDKLRKIRNSNTEIKHNKQVNQQIIASNVKIDDALFHMQKAFNTLMDQ